MKDIIEYEIPNAALDDVVRRGDTIHLVPEEMPGLIEMVFAGIDFTPIKPEFLAAIQLPGSRPLSGLVRTKPGYDIHKAANCTVEEVIIDGESDEEPVLSVDASQPTGPGYLSIRPARKWRNHHLRVRWGSEQLALDLVYGFFFDCVTDTRVTPDKKSAAT